jgi:hypothetical protein
MTLMAFGAFLCSNEVNEKLKPNDPDSKTQADQDEPYHTPHDDSP